MTAMALFGLLCIVSFPVVLIGKHRFVHKEIHHNVYDNLDED